jgi:hypothetical protein
VRRSAYQAPRAPIRSDIDRARAWKGLAAFVTLSVADIKRRVRPWLTMRSVMLAGHPDLADEEQVAVARGLPLLAEEAPTFSTDRVRVLLLEEQRRGPKTQHGLHLADALLLRMLPGLLRQPGAAVMIEALVFEQAWITRDETQAKNPDNAYTTGARQARRKAMTKRLKAAYRLLQVGADHWRVIRTLHALDPDLALELLGQVTTADVLAALRAK